MRALISGKAFVAVLFAALLVLPFVTNPYIIFFGNLVLIYIMAAIGLNVLFGYTGELAFANAAMLGIGAYGAGLLQVRLGVPFWLALPSGALIAMAIGTVIALPALRLKGLYLALATVAFAEFSRWVFIQWDAVTFGAGGFHIKPVDFSPVPIPSALGVYLVSWLISLGSIVVAWRMMGSRLGRALVAIRDGDVAAESLGIDLLRYKAFAFAFSGFYAGLAGGLYAALLSFVAPENYNLVQMIMHKAMVVVGGVGSILGSVLGATLLVVLYEALRGFQYLQEIAFGILLILFVALMPRGLVQPLKRWLPGWEEPLHDERVRGTVDRRAESPVDREDDGVRLKPPVAAGD